MRGENHKLEVSLESHQLVTIGRMVANGLGVSVVPALCIQQMRELGACCIPLTKPKIEKPIGILSMVDHEFSVAAQAIADILIEFSE